MKTEKELIDSIMRDALVDAYGIDEELMGWESYIEDEIEFPFSVKVLDRIEEADGVEIRAHELKFQIYIKNTKYLIGIGDVELLIDVNNPGMRKVKRIISAYRQWLSCL